MSEDDGRIPTVVPRGTMQVYPIRLACPDCNQELSWEIHPRTGVQDRRVLICQTNSCKQFGKRWEAPALTLSPAP